MLKRFAPVSSFSTLVVCLLFLSACGGSNSDQDDDQDPLPETRSFSMGFTPWPYDASIAAINNTYDLIQTNGDMVAHHLMDGIPWDEAYALTSLPTNVENEVNSRLNNTDSDQVIYLAVDALNGGRDGLAFNWGSSGNETLTTPWDTRSFDDQEVIDAYTNFALDMIDRFDPEYFNYASEVSELLLNDPDTYNEFLVFAEAVYENIKTAHPNLPVMVSIALKDPSSANATTISNGFVNLIDYVDLVGISVYPYVFFDHTDRGNPTNLPVNWLSQISAIAGNKPVAITETGWIAEDLEILNFSYSEESSTAFQADFVETLLGEADALDAEFVIWFSLIDYDALWEGVLGEDDLSKIWKDTGLIDPMLSARPGLANWNEYLLREKE